MSEESLAVQRLIRDRLRGDAAVTALVATGSIFDRNERPEVFPCIIIGEAQTVGDDIDCGQLSDVYSTIHVWAREDGLRECKLIAGAVRRAMWQAAGTVDGFNIDSTRFEDSRFLRDPSGMHSHGIVTFISSVEEA